MRQYRRLLQSARTRDAHRAGCARAGLVLMAFACALLAGCSEECEPKAATSGSAERIARAMASEYAALPNTEDVAVGSGRMGLPSDRLHFRAQLRDDAGTLVADGPFDLELRRPQLVGHTLKRSGVVRFPAYVYGSVNGMREGGVREFDLRIPRQYPDYCLHARNGCYVPIGERGTVIDTDRTYRLRVTLESTCAPQYCVRREWSIPLNESDQLVERGCGKG